MLLFKRFLFIPCLLFFNFLLAQNYQAINGSSYAGSLAPSSNPASIVHVPYAWDITPFSVQVKQTTNAYMVKNLSLLSSPNNAEILPDNGTKKRFQFANQDIRLLNTRISLNSKAAIAFGATIRNYIYATTSRANFQDTMYSLADFMKLNSGSLPLSAEASGSTWAELYATYAQTIIDDGDKLLNAGATIKLNRALAGGYAIAEGLSYTPTILSGIPAYLVAKGNLQYGYSANIDAIKSSNTGTANKKAFLENNTTGLSVDMGLEYIRLSEEDKEEGGDFAYETKIGISMMDIGRNNFKFGSRSRSGSGVRAGITDTVLENKFSVVESFDQFNDSLATIAATFRGLTGQFNIYQPTRMVINIDQHILHNVFLNMELTIPVTPLVAKKLRYIKDINLLAVTPRWELKSVGAYMPILVNNRGQVWVGGAFKAGPVLMGTHNLSNLFGKNKMQSGGFYVALTIRPGKKYDRQAHYPKNRLSDKDTRTYQCPK